jgi:hypothetical protein
VRKGGSRMPVQMTVAALPAPADPAALPTEDATVPPAPSAGYQAWSVSQCGQRTEVETGATKTKPQPQV